MGHMYCGLVWHLIAEGARMKTGRPKPALVLTADEDGAVAELGDSSLDPPASGRIRGMSLLSHMGLSNAVIAEKMGVTKTAVGKWRQRFITARLVVLAKVRTARDECTQRWGYGENTDN